MTKATFLRQGLPDSCSAGSTVMLQNNEGCYITVSNEEVLLPYFIFPGRNYILLAV